MSEDRITQLEAEQIKLSNEAKTCVDDLEKTATNIKDMQNQIKRKRWEMRRLRKKLIITSCVFVAIIAILIIIKNYI